MRVAPGKKDLDSKALKERNTRGDISHFQCSLKLILLTRGDAVRSAHRLPLAFIFRAFGAPLNY
jgi:hypothetical protein